MSFIKRGDAQPILSVSKSMTEEEEEKVKKALEEAKKKAKEINKEGDNKSNTSE